MMHFLNRGVDDEGSGLYRLIEEMDRIVCDCAKTALCLSALDTSNRKLELWVEAATSYLLTGESDFTLFTSYGYAVEELSNCIIGYKLTAGGRYKIVLQQSYSGTRPDIVIRLSDSDVAWLDITSCNNQDHVLKKNSSNWRRIKWVVELLYPDLNLSNIQMGDGVGIGPRAKAQHQMRMNAIHNRNFTVYMVAKMKCVLSNIFFNSDLSGCSYPQGEIARIVESVFQVKLPNSMKHKTIKSLLQWFWNDCPDAFWDPYAKEALRKYYASCGQDKTSARGYVEESYREERSRSEIYVK